MVFICLPAESIGIFLLSNSNLDAKPLGSAWNSAIGIPVSSLLTADLGASQLPQSCEPVPYNESHYICIRNPLVLFLWRTLDFYWLNLITLPLFAFSSIVLRFEIILITLILLLMISLKSFFFLSFSETNNISIYNWATYFAVGTSF